MTLSNFEIVLTFEIFRDEKKEYRFRLQAANHETIAVSSEGYKNRKDCLAAIELVKASGDAPVKVKRKKL